MIHEAMVLEYSGRSLAFIEMAGYIKQMIFFVIIAQVVFPAGPVLGGPAHILLWVLWFVLRFVIITVAVALLEVSLAKMRLFRVADFLAFAFVLGAVAVVCAVLGV